MRTKPGPGEYDPPVSGQFKRTAYSISGLNKKFIEGTESKFKQPGPGTYEDCIALHYKSIPGSKINKDKRNSFFLKTSVTGNPDPGNYEKDAFTKLNAIPMYSFGKS